MNRFFSKLNLSDIKIKAEGNSFPPDADEQPEPQQDEFHAQSESAAATAVVDTPAEPEVESTAYEQEYEPATETEPEVDVHQNGHITVTSPYTDATVTIESPTEVEEPVYEAPAVQESAPTATGITEIVADDVVYNVGEVLKVSARSRPSAVAGAIAGVVREVGKAEVQAIGAGATNQAIKAVAIARDYLQESDIDAICVPAFIDVTIENEDRTAIRLVVEPR